ncbi:uncharacterized protein KGF55_001590 [Candida pseudojiufengensis]|uniref:uncharacterized protein n=1 Tax=Candida pseudojiufengensis TaxID=497109 RepID=UPI002224747F|nr:uncharacterized protein KGF55_001590 [Candida pseudojiufengensis]KAI5965369.1 hypothetical protein KGF55_001590 [Candida pseudojiufengensis]
MVEQSSSSVGDIKEEVTTDPIFQKIIQSKQQTSTQQSQDQDHNQSINSKQQQDQVIQQQKQLNLHQQQSQQQQQQQQLQQQQQQQQQLQYQHESTISPQVDDTLPTNQFGNLTKSQRMDLAYDFHQKILKLPIDQRWSNRKIARFHGISEGGLRARLKRGSRQPAVEQALEMNQDELASIASSSIKHKPIMFQNDEITLVNLLNEKKSNNEFFDDQYILEMANWIIKSSYEKLTKEQDENGSNGTGTTQLRDAFLAQKNELNNFVDMAWVSAFKRRNKALFKKSRKNSNSSSSTNKRRKPSNATATPTTTTALPPPTISSSEEEVEEELNYDPSLPEPEPMPKEEIEKLSKTERMEKAYIFNQLQRVSLPPKSRWSNRKIAKHHGVSESGLRGRLKRGNESSNGHIKRRKLNVDEENRIKDHIKNVIDKPITSTMITNIANSILKDKNINDSNQFVTRSWVRNFKKRNPDLNYQRSSQKSNDDSNNNNNNADEDEDDGENGGEDEAQYNGNDETDDEVDDHNNEFSAQNSNNNNSNNADVKIEVGK